MQASAPISGTTMSAVSSKSLPYRSDSASWRVQHQDQDHSQDNAGKADRPVGLKLAGLQITDRPAEAPCRLSNPVHDPVYHVGVEPAQQAAQHLVEQEADDDLLV